ncbi:hypothetical protein B566_EDAN018935 [Ephemera danica]|nr:hypothetical protein B566_EDAN018935 [Ephemera danica]
MHRLTNTYKINWQYGRVQRLKSWIQSKLSHIVISIIGMKWMILYARKRGDKTMTDRLANEIMSAAKGEGAAVKKKDDTHRMADANKAFSHFRV